VVRPCTYKYAPSAVAKIRLPRLIGETNLSAGG